MGDASRRKKFDPLYGAVGEQDRDHGIVLCTPMSFESARSVSIRPFLDPVELRFSLLFFDKIVFPDTSIIKINDGGEIDFLIKAGVMERPNYQIYGDMASGMLNTQLQAFSERESKAPGKWSLLTGDGGLKVMSPIEGWEKNDQDISMQMLKSIPVPQFEVPFNEVLEFKQRRSDELLILRAEIRKVVGDVESSGGSQDVLNKKISDIDGACRDLIRCAKEFDLPFQVGDLKVSFGFSPVSAVLATYGVKELMATGQLMGSFIAAAASTIQFNRDLGFSRIRKSASPYRYVTRIHQELN